ncbi:MAG: integrase arm-type DNA-binding domain-containing protein [Rhodosalinus sp.]
MPAGKHCDGRGLWLHERSDAGAQWVYRFTLCGRTREMGLGALRDVGLAEAREAAETARRLVAREIDPINERPRAGEPQGWPSRGRRRGRLRGAPQDTQERRLGHNVVQPVSQSCAAKARRAPKRCA